MTADRLSARARIVAYLQQAGLSTARAEASIDALLAEQPAALPSVVVSADRATLLAEVATALIGRHCSPESIAVVRRLVDERLCTTCQAYGQTVEDTTDGGIVWRCKGCNGEGMRRVAAEEQPTETQDGEVDADTVAKRAAQVISTMGADIRALTQERNRYRNAWHNARARAADAEDNVRVVEAETHSCSNCEGIDPDTCLMNPDRPTSRAAEAGPAQEPETEEQRVRAHVTTLHLIGEQLAGVESWMWEHLANVRDAERPAAGEQPDTQTREARPPAHRWWIETLDNAADEWAPGTRYTDRTEALERYGIVSAHYPLWKDGTPVQRRFVRETTSYTVEDSAP